jgi:hypothetical protein
MDSDPTETNDPEETQEPMDTSVGPLVDPNDSFVATTQPSRVPKQSTSDDILDRLYKHFQQANQFNFDDYLTSFVELLHYDTILCENVWLHLFNAFWQNLNNEERNILGKNLAAFLLSAMMLPQKDVPNSVAKCFLNSFLLCDPPVHLRSSHIKYISETHKSW